MKIMKILAIFLMPVLLISCGLFISPRNEIQEVTLGPVIDGYIDSNLPPTLRDFDTSIMKVHQGGPSFYSIIQFDGIPIGAQILSARLIFTCVNVGGGGDIWINRIKEPWEKTTIDMNIDFVFDDIMFFIAGPPPPPPERFFIEIRSIVQSWANGNPNYGLILSPDTPTPPNDIDFETVESGNKPELFIRYY